MTTETLFSIGSSTKAFTALAAGILADEKILDLDRPVKEYHMVCEMTEVNENNTNMGNYGLGWLIEPYRGLRMVSHGGNIDGFTSHVAFIPAEKIGVVVLSNLNGTRQQTVRQLQARKNPLFQCPHPCWI